MNEPKQHTQWTLAQSLMITALVANHVAFLAGVQPLVLVLPCLLVVLIGLVRLGMRRMAFSYFTALICGAFLAVLGSSASRSQSYTSFTRSECSSFEKIAIDVNMNFEELNLRLSDYEAKFNPMDLERDPLFGLLMDPWGEPYRCLSTKAKPGFAFASAGPNRLWESGEGDDITSNKPLVKEIEMNEWQIMGFMMTLLGAPVFITCICLLHDW